MESHTAKRRKKRSEGVRGRGGDEKGTKEEEEEEEGGSGRKLHEHVCVCKY